jgi:hypothetical protein
MSDTVNSVMTYTDLHVKIDPASLNLAVNPAVTKKSCTDQKTSSLRWYATRLGLPELETRLLRMIRKRIGNPLMHRAKETIDAVS